MVAITSSSHREQDSTTFATIYHLAYSTLIGLAEQMVGDRQCAEDIIQDVLLQVWQEGKFASNTSGLLAQLENAVSTRCQRVMGEVLLESSEVVEERETPWFAVEQAVFADQTLTPVAIALQSLPVRYRKVIEARYLEGLSFTETARVLHLTPVVLQKRMGVALRTMKRFLRESSRVEEWFLGATSTPRSGMNPVR